MADIPRGSVRVSDVANLGRSLEKKTAPEGAVFNTLKQLSYF